MRDLGSGSAPISAVRSAVATITLTATPAGNVTGVTIGGVNQISGNVAMTAGNPTSSAISVANAINTFTPASGPDYTASSIGDTVYIFSPPSDGDASNGLAVTISVSTVSITFTTTDFSGGSDETGVYDSVVGLRFFLNPLANASRSSLSGATEITKYIVLRGLQTGIVTKSLVVNNDKLTGIDRSCAITNIYVDTQSSAATDELSFIETVDFVEGDVIKLSQYATGRVVVVTDNTVSAGVGNLYLTDAVSFNCQDNKSIELQLKYDSTLGLIWVENGRSISGGAVQLTRIEMRALITAGAVQQGQSYFITDVGQAGIIVAGIDSNSITTQGDYIGYFPDYQNVSGDFVAVWYVLDPSVTTGSLYAFKGLMYESLTGVTGSDPNGDATNWALIPITDPRYQKEVLTVQYNIDSNTVTQGADSRGNIIAGIAGFQTFKWGCDTCYSNIIAQSTLEFYDIEGEVSGNILGVAACAASSGIRNFVGNLFNNTYFTFSPSGGGKIDFLYNSGNGTDAGGISIENGSALLMTVSANVFNIGTNFCTITGSANTVTNNVFGCGFDSSYTVTCSTFTLERSYISRQISLQANTLAITVNDFISTLEATIDLDTAVAANVLTIPATAINAGKLICTSTTTKTINKITTSSTYNFPITITPANGISTIITRIAVASAVTDNVVGAAAGSTTLVGRTNGSDFYVLQRNGTFWSTLNSLVHG